MSSRARVTAADSWSRALDAHRAAVDEFLDRAAAVPPARWHEPLAPGKWSPAQEVAHVSLSYATFARVLAGEQGTLEVSPWKALLMRRFVLPRILASGRFPRARAPRVLRPDAAPAEQSALVAELRAHAGRCEATLGAATGARASEIVHPYFGPITPLDTLRLLVVHTRHHTAHLSARSPTEAAG